MTSDQIKTIDWLRAQGCGYRRIAERTGISMNTVKSSLMNCQVIPSWPNTDIPTMLYTTIRKNMRA